MNDIQEAASRLAVQAPLSTQAAEIIVETVFKLTIHDEPRQALLDAVSSLSQHGVDAVELVLGLRAFANVVQQHPAYTRTPT